MLEAHIKMGSLTKSEDPDEMRQNVAFHQGLHFLLSSKQSLGTGIHHTLEIPTCDPVKYTLNRSSKWPLFNFVFMILK